MYKAYGLPSLADLLCSYPLSLLAVDSPHDFVGKNNVVVLEDSILATGKTLLGTTRTYSQAQALCKAWRRTDKQRTTAISIPTPISRA